MPKRDKGPQSGTVFVLPDSTRVRPGEDDSNDPSRTDTTAASLTRETTEGFFNRSEDTEWIEQDVVGSPQFVKVRSSRNNSGNFAEASPKNEEDFSEDAPRLVNDSSYVDEAASPTTARRQLKSARQNRWFKLWLYRLKKYYLVAHLAYIMIVALINSIIFYLVEADLKEDGKVVGIRYIDALFIAVSASTCTGLATVNMLNFSPYSVAAQHIGVTLSGTVFTSLFAPALRLYTLSRLFKEEVVLKKAKHITEGRRDWGRKKRIYIQQLMVTSKIVIGSVLLYWFVIQIVSFALLNIQLDVTLAATRTISCFTNGVFMSGAPTRHDTFSIIVFMVLMCSGSTLFAPYLRLWLIMERRLLHLFLSARHGKVMLIDSAFEPLPELEPLNPVDDENSLNVSLPRTGKSRQSSTIPAVAAVNTAGDPQSNQENGRKEDDGMHTDDEDEDEKAEEQRRRLRQSSLDSNIQIRQSFLNPTRLRSQSMMRRREIQGRKNKWLSGFNRLLTTDDPVYYHAFLFNPRDSFYLFIAWLFVTELLTVPMLAQQWDRTLKNYSFVDKFVVSHGQVIGNRFSGLVFIPETNFSPANVMLLIFGLYVPPLPIPTDRTRRKWRQMFGRGVWRLLTSRFWWLFIAVVSIVFLEENRQHFGSDDHTFGMNTRVMFEVASAYATSGVSLPLSAHTNSSFCGGFCDASKVILMFVMLAGRHRGMDFGLDIGLTELAKTEGALDEEEEEEEDTRKHETEPHTFDESPSTPTFAERTRLEPRH